MKHFAKILALGAALVASAPLAMATPISGSIGFGGNGTYLASSGQFTAGAILYPGATGNAQVNTTTSGTLTPFTFNNIANFSSFNTNALGAGVQVFTTTESGVTLTFKLTSFIPGDSSNTAGDGFTGTGVLSETGYTDTAATFSLNTNKGAGTFITFNTATVAPTPEPSSLMLLGTGLVSAAGMLVRRRRIV